jgi:rare lipoprotein A
MMEQQDSAPSTSVDINSIPNAVPRTEPLSKYGNPESYVVNGSRYYVKHSSSGYRARGIASWYGTKFHGRRTSSGEPYDMYKMTAAHKTLPLPSYVRVTNLENGRRVVVRVNDRGPFHGGRLIDLSYVAARKLGITGNGTAQVEIEAIDPTQPVSSQQHQAVAQPVSATGQSFAGQQFYLQLGAFSERENAEQMLSKLLRQTSQPVHISQGNVAQGRLYRVRVGPYPSRDSLQRLESQFIGLGYQGAHIVADQH